MTSKSCVAQGGDGDDLLVGGVNSYDTLYGDGYYTTKAGRDRLYGRGKADTLVGGGGGDTLNGGDDSETVDEDKPGAF